MESWDVHVECFIRLTVCAPRTTLHWNTIHIITLSRPLYGALPTPNGLEIFIYYPLAAEMETQLDSCDAALRIMFHKHGNEKWKAYLAVIGTWDICQIVFPK